MSLAVASLTLLVKQVWKMSVHECQAHAVQMKSCGCVVCFQPGYMVTQGRLSIQLTVRDSSVASKTPPMRELKTISLNRFTVE